MFLDEARDLDGSMVQEVILPQMNVSRRMLNGLVNPYEKFNTQVIYATSAGMKSSYSYDALLDTFERAIIDPKNACCIGLDYRIPVMHGLIDGNYVRNLKMSPSYNEVTFSAEYMGNWLGGSDESWFQFDKLSKYRRIKNPEWKQKFVNDTKVFYLITVDVARTSTGDQSIAEVFRVNIKDNRYYVTVVFLDVLGKQAETKTFERQAIDIKKLIALYNPKEVVIDINGVGMGLGDFMIQQQYDENGILLPAYGFINNKEYQKVQSHDCIPLLYGIKANGPLNSQIHSNAYTRLNSGLVHFLVTEQEARAKLLNTKVGQEMTIEQRVRRLLPHEMTTKLFTQMSNLRLKKTGLDIALEQINSRYPKDMYSAFAYGLWRIKELEEENYKHVKRLSNFANRQLVFFTGGN